MAEHYSRDAERKHLAKEGMARLDRVTRAAARKKPAK
jgi:hypothetical protein